MIESKESYESFYKEVAGHDLILHPVLSEPDSHTAACHAIAVFIHDVQTNKPYTISFSHPDIDFKVARNDLTFRFNKQNNRLWAIDKKSFIQTLPMVGIHDINLLRFLKNTPILEPKEATPAHNFIKRMYANYSNVEGGLGRVLPIVKHKEPFTEMVRECCETVKNAEIDDVYNKLNTTVLETLAELELNGIHVDKTCFNKHFNAKVYSVKYISPDTVYSQYNIYTATGRPSNRYDGVNYAALKKEGGCRKCFVSRWKPDWHTENNQAVITKKHGKMVLIDYSSYHPRIICYLMGFDMPLETDIYQYLGELYFNKTNLTPVDIDEAKIITFRQLYGRLEPQYKHIKFLVHARRFIEDYWNHFQKHGYVETPIFKRKITDSVLQDPNPAKLLNYILQATEGEIAIPVITELNNFLREKHSKAILYTYDSVLFDFCHWDGKETLQRIIDIMKKDNKFPVKVYVGDNYDELNQFSIS